MTFALWRAATTASFTMNPIIAVVALLILVKWAAEWWLIRLNRIYVLQHAGAVPEAFKEIIDPATYARSREYTLAKSRLHQWELLWGTAVLLAMLLGGVLPPAFEWFVARFGDSIWSMAAFLFTTGLALSFAGLPFDWYAQFRLEERFGFNTTTQRLWWLDRAKGLLQRKLHAVTPAEAFSFDGSRCDRLVAGVMRRLAGARLLLRLS